MLTVEIEELKVKGEKREKDVFDKILSDKEFLVEEITSLQDLLEEKLKDKTTNINHKLDKLKSNTVNIVEAFLEQRRMHLERQMSFMF